MVRSFSLSTVLNLSFLKAYNYLQNAILPLCTCITSILTKLQVSISLNSGVLLYVFIYRSPVQFGSLLQI